MNAVTELRNVSLAQIAQAWAEALTNLTGQATEVVISKLEIDQPNRAWVDPSGASVELRIVPASKYRDLNGMQAADE